MESVNRELEFSDDTFAVDLIEEVGPGGSFIDKIHTAEHFRNELWFPSLLDRDYYDTWKAKGAESMEERCRVRKEEILATHQVEPLSQDIARELDKIVETARKDLQQ